MKSWENDQNLRDSRGWPIIILPVKSKRMSVLLHNSAFGLIVQSLSRFKRFMFCLHLCRGMSRDYYPDSNDYIKFVIDFCLHLCWSLMHSTSVAWWHFFVISGKFCGRRLDCVRYIGNFVIQGLVVSGFCSTQSTECTLDKLKNVVRYSGEFVLRYIGFHCNIQNMSRPWGKEKILSDFPYTFRLFSLYWSTGRFVASEVIVTRFNHLFGWKEPGPGCTCQMLTLGSVPLGADYMEGGRSLH